MRLRHACSAAALAVLAAAPAAVATPSASTGGPAAVDEPTAITCPATAGSPRLGAAAASARALLRIPSRPRVTGRRVTVAAEVAASGCLTLTLYPRGARRLDATTRIGILARAIGEAGPTRSVVALNARGRRLLKARRTVSAMLITDFRAGADGTGAEVTLSTPVWF